MIISCQHNKQTVDLGKERLYSKGRWQESEKNNKENALWDLQNSQLLRKKERDFIL